MPAGRKEALPHVPSQMERVWGTAAAAWVRRRGDAEGGMGKGSSTAGKGWEASWKNRVSAQSPGGNRQRDPVHAGGERTAWVTAMHKIHQSCSAENKPLGNTPFLLGVGKGVWGCVFTSPFIII